MFDLSCPILQKGRLLAYEREQSKEANLVRGQSELFCLTERYVANVASEFDSGPFKISTDSVPSVCSNKSSLSIFVAHIEASVTMCPIDIEPIEPNNNDYLSR
ncbi:hypothetical protein EVAR_77095_1 [Eumeta japonica]|uniref:Uncharacterized protein n=1 Tax=Eumeta variegata TaxID=151549 RepID=A0A4C1T2H6_EUMVA|nr:hypothetical protein EVAR_77095_1 [Eumeta japonica]